MSPPTPARRPPRSSSPPICNRRRHVEGADMPRGSRPARGNAGSESRPAGRCAWFVAMFPCSLWRCLTISSIAVENWKIPNNWPRPSSYGTAGNRRIGHIERRPVEPGSMPLHEIDQPAPKRMRVNDVAQREKPPMISASAMRTAAFVSWHALLRRAHEVHDPAGHAKRQTPEVKKLIKPALPAILHGVQES